MPDDKQRGKTIVFFHPDLGIGGAERLVVDAAVGLQKRGHRVVIFTSHCDPAHCFDEARDGTLDVRVRGNTLVPTAILGRFAILCAILRQLHLLLHIALFTGELAALAPDAFFVDQLSAGLPLLRCLSPAAPVLFYCHFPDLLLARGRARLWKRLYRVPFDALEQWSMGFADAVAVNSAFTRSVVARTWPALARKKDLKVVYPCIDTTTSSSPPPAKSSSSGSNRDEQHADQMMMGPLLPWKRNGLILSINRFERKKDVGLALRAFARLPPERRRRAKLVLAGGYDHRVAENVAYHAELCALADELGLRHATARTVVAALRPRPSSSPSSSASVPGGSDDDDDDDVPVLFLLSVPNALKDALLRSAALLVYTPRGEHFGIVPLEAMLRRVPVLAADSGGPRETVVDGVTGWLRDPDEVGAWSEVMGKVLDDLGGDELDRMGRAGERRVREKFAVGQMAERLEGLFKEMMMMEEGRGGSGRRGLSVGLLVVAGVVALGGLLLGAVVLGRGRG